MRKTGDRGSGIEKALALLLICAAHPLVAQDTVAVLPPIVVRGEDTPRFTLARTVLTSTDIQGARAGAFLDEALARAAGVTAQNRGSFALDTRLVVRGAGARSAFGVRGVTVLLDGVPQTLPDGQAGLSQVDMASLERIEVVRGAAAAHYGNAAGGALLLRTQDPLGARWSARVRASGGDGSNTIGLGARGRVGAGGMSLSASRTSQDGWRRYAAGELVQASAALAWPVSPGALIRLSTRVADLARAENPGALDSAQLAADPRQAVARNVAFHAGKRATEWQQALTLTRAGERGEASAAVFHVARDLDNPLPTSWVKLDRSDAGLRLAGRWTVRGARDLELSGGIDAQRQNDARRNFANDSGRIGATATLDQVETVTAIGARSGARIALTPRSGAWAGLRYDRVSFRVKDALTGDGDASGSRAMDAMSFSIGADQRFSDVRLHASVSSAFETPTTTELARPGIGGMNLSLSPQRTMQREVGAEWSRGRSRITAAVYDASVRDALVPREEPTAPGRFYFVNAARVRLRGIEVEAAARVTSWVRLAASATWTDHVYRSFPTDSTPLNGRHVPGLPRAGAYALASIGGLTGPLTEAEVVYTGRMFADDANTASANPSTQLHLRFGWMSSRRSVFGGVRNALDARVVGSVNVNGALRRFYEPAPGRTWYLGVEGRLGG